MTDKTDGQPATTDMRTRWLADLERDGVCLWVSWDPKAAPGARVRIDLRARDGDELQPRFEAYVHLDAAAAEEVALALTLAADLDRAAASEGGIDVTDETDDRPAAAEGADVEGLARALWRAEWGEEPPYDWATQHGVRAHYRRQARAGLAYLAGGEAVVVRREDLQAVLDELERMFLALGWSSVPEVAHDAAIDRFKDVLARLRAVWEGEEVSNEGYAPGDRVAVRFDDQTVMATVHDSTNQGELAHTEMVLVDLPAVAFTGNPAWTQPAGLYWVDPERVTTEETR